MNTLSLEVLIPILENQEQERALLGSMDPWTSSMEKAQHWLKAAQAAQEVEAAVNEQLGQNLAAMEEGRPLLAVDDDTSEECYKFWDECGANEYKSKGYCHSIFIVWAIGDAFITMLLYSDVTTDIPLIVTFGILFFFVPLVICVTFYVSIWYCAYKYQKKKEEESVSKASQNELMSKAKETQEAIKLTSQVITETIGQQLKSCSTLNTDTDRSKFLSMMKTCSDLTTAMKEVQTLCKNTIHLENPSAKLMVEAAQNVLEVLSKARQLSIQLHEQLSSAHDPLTA